METDNNKLRHKNHKMMHGIGLPLLLILSGVMFLLFNLGVIPEIYKPVLLSWRTLILVIGIWSLIRKRFAPGIVLTFIGFLFVLHKLRLIFPEILGGSCEMGSHFLLPVILIGFGVGIIVFKLFFKHKHDGSHGKCYGHFDEKDSSDYIDKNLMFSGSKQIILSQNFKGGEAGVVMAGLEIDLRKAKLADDGALLKLDVAFGGVTIYVPTDWNVDFSCDAIFGGFEDKRQISELSDFENAPRLFIKVSCMFGGGEIKN